MDNRGVMEMSYEAWAEQKLAKHPDGVKLSPADSQLLHVAIGLTTEAAEFLDLIKKHVFMGHPIDAVMRTKLLNELGDARFYQAMCLVSMRTTLSEVEALNREKLNARYAKAFTTAESVNRASDTEQPEVKKSFLPQGLEAAAKEKA